MSRTQKTRKEEVLGFGFVPSAQPHHFLVTIPKAGEDDRMYISEHLDWDDSQARRELHFALGKEDNKVRVSLARSKWDAIAEEIRGDFNRRLRDHGLPAGKWSAGQVPVSRLLGKELVVLAWAIEDADPSLIPVAIRNWRGLAPEERWWLYTMTNAATGHALTGRNRGWRKAVRFALTENPVSDDAFEYRRSQPELSLFRELAAADAERRPNPDDRHAGESRPLNGDSSSLKRK